MRPFRFYTGSYTEEDLFPGSRGEGIRLWELNPGTGCIESITTYDGVSNPSWLALHPTGQLLAAASEHVDGASRVCLMKVDPEGSLKLTDSVFSGDATCHAGFSPDGRFLATAAYVSGEVCLMRIEGGSFKGNAQSYSYEGSGPNPERQEAPHAHQVLFSPDGHFLYVTDLGTDRIWCHTIADGTLGQPVSSLALPAGEGPRHMVVDWDRSMGFVLAELTGRVHVFFVDRNSGAFTFCDSISSLPGDWSIAPSSAAIRLHPSRRFVYVSNRNGGRITAFRIKEDKPQLELCGIWNPRDPSPRDIHITPDGRWLVVAGQETHRLYVYPLDTASGEVGPTAFEADCGSPVCIAWAASLS